MVDSIELFFQGLNFVLLAGVCVYFIYTRFWPSIIKALEVQTQEHKAKRLQQNRFLEQATNIMYKIEQDRLRAQFLHQSVMTWRNVITQVCERRAQEQQERSCQISIKRKLQFDTWQHRVYEQKVIPLAIEQARITLEKKYSQKVMQEHYINDIMIIFERGTRG